MKIVFWGTPKYAAENLLTLIKAGNEICAVVTQPDRRRSRGKVLSPSPVKQVAIDFDIPVYSSGSISKDIYTKKLLSKLNADIYIVVAFGQILSTDILEQPKFGCWNSHASLLPKWRGAAPIQWSIINNDLITGVCIIAMEKGLDTGPVVLQESINIIDSDNLETLTNKLCKISSQLLIKLIMKIKSIKDLDHEERLKKLKLIDQSKLNGQPSYARQILKEDFIIDWNQKAKNIYKRIQGLYPNSYTLYKGKRIKVYQANIINNSFIKENPNNGLEELINNKNTYPGEIVFISKKLGFAVSTIDYPILIEVAQLEGKHKSDAYTISIQSRLTIHEKLCN